MIKFDAKQIRAFLEALDRHLDEPRRLILIGGSAAALAYGVERTTRDIDTWSEWVRDVAGAISKARADTGLAITAEYAAVADGPYEFESRLERVNLPALARLEILVPEKHDLVLMKIVRGYEHDLETAVDIHARHGLDFETLFARFASEMDHVVGDRRKLDLNFLALVERLYDEKRLEEAGRRLLALRHRR